MVEITLKKSNLVPDDKLLLRALWAGILASVILWAISTFGLSPVLNFIPDGFETLALVFASVYLSGLLVIKHKGREVI